MNIFIFIPKPSDYKWISGKIECAGWIERQKIAERIKNEQWEEEKPKDSEENNNKGNKKDFKEPKGPEKANNSQEQNQNNDSQESDNDQKSSPRNKENEQKNIKPFESNLAKSVKLIGIISLILAGGVLFALFIRKRKKQLDR